MKVVLNTINHIPIFNCVNADADTAHAVEKHIFLSLGILSISQTSNVCNISIHLTIETIFGITTLIKLKIMDGKYVEWKFLLSENVKFITTNTILVHAPPIKTL